MYFTDICYTSGRFPVKEILVMPFPVLLYLLKQIYNKQTLLWCSPVLQYGTEVR